MDSCRQAAVVAGPGFDSVLISVDDVDNQHHQHSNHHLLSHNCLHLSTELYNKASATTATAADSAELLQLPIKASSLNRLDTMDDGGRGGGGEGRGSPLAGGLQADLNVFSGSASGFTVYRCPSLPGLDRYLSASARTVSTTNLETDLESLSPRVSMTTLSQDLDSRDLFGLSLSSVACLARSVSARTIGRVATTSSPFQAGGVEFLQQGPGGTRTTKPATKTGDSSTLDPIYYKQRKSTVVGKFGRSASSPSLLQGYVCQQQPWVYRKAPNSPGTATAAEERPHARRSDVDLEGEEVKDLPVEPSRNFPDFVPELLLLQYDVVVNVVRDLPQQQDESKLQSSRRQSPICPPPSSVGEVGGPLASRKCHEKQTTFQNEDQLPPYPLPLPPCPNRCSEGDGGRLTTKKNYVNIGDITSSTAPLPVIVNEDRHRCGGGGSRHQRAPRLVQIKCLQWLNSLDRQ